MLVGLGEVRTLLEDGGINACVDDAATGIFIASQEAKVEAASHAL